MTVRATVLDVGHGNSAVIEYGAYCAVVDAPPGGVLDEALADRDLYEIDDLLLSHGDADHCGGAATLLTGERVRVRRLRVNPEPLRATRIWDDLVSAALVADREKRTVVHTRLAAGERIASEDGRVEIQVIAPTHASLLIGGAGVAPGKAAACAGATTRTANSLSAVVRVAYDGVGRLLLPGDLDADELRDMVRDGADIASEVLVFPHHGGLPGRADPVQFTADLLAAVRPSLVVFSVGRTRVGFPRAEIIAAIRDAGTNFRIACTQLASQCASEVSGPAHAMHTRIPGMGARVGHACAGSLMFSWMEGDHVEVYPGASDHAAFIAGAAPTAMCLN